MIKLIAIDLDGTLLDSQHRVSNRNKKAIQDAIDEGINIVICTGRPVSGVMPLIEELGMNSQHHYFVLNNGCTIHQGGQLTCIHSEEITLDDLDYLYQLSQSVEGLDLALTLPSGYYLIRQDVPDFIARDAAIVHTEAIPITLEEVLQKKEPIYLGMFMGDAKVLDSFQKEYEEVLNKRFSTTRSQAYIFENLPKGVTKASSLEKLAKQLEINSDEVMALGDADNDIPMLAYAGYSVAMGNASNEVKQVCRYQTSSNDDYGVALAIETYALKKK